MNAAFADWLDRHTWPQIHAMMLNDAYFKLYRYARQTYDDIVGPIGGMIYSGYISSQMICIRRLCDDRRDVFSLRRLLLEVRAASLCVPAVIDKLMGQLDECERVCRMVNDHVAHTANPQRRHRFSEWNLKEPDLTNAQRAICRVAIRLDRDVLMRRNYVKILPVPQFDIMREFRPWVPEKDIQDLWGFWHHNSDEVNSWVPASPGWDDFFQNALPVSDDFMVDREDPPPQEREPFC